MPEISPLISVIVPVYNVEKYLNQCVDSLINQKYKNLEIILVDDGSTDASSGLCDLWSKRDKRVHVIHQSNQGLAAARNTGLDYANGEYIGFVDSDDYILPNMYQTMLDNLLEAKADLSIISYERENPDGSTYCNALPNQKIIMTSLEAFMYVNQRGYFYVAPWDKLAKRTLFENLRYPTDATHTEDAPVAYSLLDRANRIVYDSTPLYRYRMTENGQSKGITDKFAYFTGEMLTMVREKYPAAEQYAIYGHLDSIVGTYNRIALTHQQKQWTSFEKYAQSELHTLLPELKHTGIISRKQLMQWKLLSNFPMLYRLMYRKYKLHHNEISSH